MDFLNTLLYIVMFILAIWKLKDLFFGKVEEINPELSGLTLIVLMYSIISKEIGKTNPTKEEIREALDRYKRWCQNNRVPDDFMDNLESALDEFKR